MEHTYKRREHLCSDQTDVIKSVIEQRIFHNLKNSFGFFCFNIQHTCKMTKFHTSSQNQPTQGQGLRRCNSIGGITRLSRRRIRRHQRRFQPFRAVSSLRGRNPMSLTRGEYCPSLQLPNAGSDTVNCRDMPSAGSHTSSDVKTDHSVTWTVTDVSTPQGRKLIIKRGGKGSSPTKRQSGNVSIVKCRLRNGRRKRLASMSQNYFEKISGSDGSVEVSDEDRASSTCEVRASLASQDENRYIGDGLTTKNDVIKGGLIARGNDVTFTDCRRLRRENTLIFDSDVTIKGATNRVTTSVTNTVIDPVTNPVIDPVTDPIPDPVTNQDYNYFVDLRHQDRAEDQLQDMLTIPSERFSYKRLLAPAQHFRCVLCDTNLEALTLSTVGESLDIMDLSRFHIENHRLDVTLFCPECGFSQLGYR